MKAVRKNYYSQIMDLLDNLEDELEYLITDNLFIDDTEIDTYNDDCDNENMYSKECNDIIEDLLTY